MDNEIAVQNLTKMANQKGYGVKSEKDFRRTVQSDDGDRGRGGSREHSTVGKRCGRDRKKKKTVLQMRSMETRLL